ncbi:unnamed protein product [Adineta ricciae]|uniref:HIT-type domain-containing protein n=1 Tax=Adineta ricciae TaxID=249248 RepID=A0A814KQZ0_ADIRI|nr:unnamed protein product [Adineta ricciae]
MESYVDPKKCSICRQNPIKYTCPRCSLRTCSLSCCIEHKKTLNCNGQRDKTLFKSLNTMTDLDLLSDYRFLEEVNRQVETSKRDELANRMKSLNESTRFQKLIQSKLKSLWSIQILYLPRFSTRHKQNQMWFDRKTDDIFWHVECRVFLDTFHTWTITRMPTKDTTLANLLGKFREANQSVSPKVNNFSSEEQVCVYIENFGQKRTQFAYIFFVSGLIINFLQLCSCIIWPFNKELYRKINCYLALGIWSQFTFLAQWWSKSDCVLYIDPVDMERVRKEHAIVIMNHKYDIDWLAGWIICQRLGIMHGSKIVGKQSLRLVPIVGWCWIFTESIFLRRVWESDRETLVKDLRKVLANYPQNYFFNFLLFCEGTRFTEKKRLASMKIAQEKGLPELKHHILPRTKGFTLLLQGAENRITGIYDLNVGFKKSGAEPTFLSIIKGHACQAEIYVRRTPIADIPTDTDGCSDWVHKLYQEKDQIYDYFLRHDTFEGNGLVRVEIPRNYKDLLIELTWMIIIGIPSVIYLCKFLWTSTFLAQFIFVILVILATIGVRAMIAVTETERGSHYGENQKDK